MHLEPTISGPHTLEALQVIVNEAIKNQLLDKQKRLLQRIWCIVCIIWPVQTLNTSIGSLWPEVAFHSVIICQFVNPRTVGNGRTRSHKGLIMLHKEKNCLALVSMSGFSFNLTEYFHLLNHQAVCHLQRKLWKVNSLNHRDLWDAQIWEVEVHIKKEIELQSMQVEPIIWDLSRCKKLQWVCVY